jgi:hypothetical protein
MSNNKILIYFSLSLLVISFYLTSVASCWCEELSVGFIDHFVHVHLDLDSLKDYGILEIETPSDTPAFSRFAQDLREYGQDSSSESGTCSWGHNTD